MAETPLHLKELLTDEIINITECLLLYIDQSGEYKQLTLGDIPSKFDRKYGISSKWLYQKFINQATNQNQVHQSLVWTICFKYPESRELTLSTQSLPVIKGKLYKCGECNYKSRYKKNLDDHVNSVHDKDSTVVERNCNDVGKQSAVIGQNCNEVEVTSKDSGFLASEAAESTSPSASPSHFTKSKRILEEDQSEEDNSISCDFCSQVFTHKKLKLLHMENQHTSTNGKFYTCPTCGSKVECADWAKHMDNHRFKSKYTCKECNRIFKSQHNLKYHNLEVHEKDRFACGCCEKTFTRKNSLRDHQYGHEGIKPHLCEFCGKGYCRKSSLLKHTTSCTNT